MPVHRLLTEWRKFSPDEFPYLFPQDREAMLDGASVALRSFDEYIDSPTFGNRNDTKLHTGLLPVPFVGSLKLASVFILMINPGLCPLDYFQETQVPSFRNRLLANVYQQNERYLYPFMGLDPSLAWHSGFEYWNKKFRSLAEKIVEKRGVDYREALRTLSQSVAALELIPYHSNKFGSHRLIKTLPSVQCMHDYVHNELVPRAHRGEILIIVTRTTKYWDLSEHENIVIYKGGETRGASLTLNSRGGRRIAQHLGLVESD